MPINLADHTQQFLADEIDTLKSLLIHSDSSAQAIFNFYITFVAAIIGGIALLTQIAVSDPIRNQFFKIIVGGMLLFLASAGSIFIWSLATRAAHTARFAQGIDNLRRLLLQQASDALPELYVRFLNSDQSRVFQQIQQPHPVFWLLPAGIYQLFVTAVSSLFWATGIWVLMLAAGEISLVRVFAIFLATFLIHNAYARYVIRRIILDANVSAEI